MKNELANDTKRATIEEWDIPEVTEKERLVRQVTQDGPSNDLEKDGSEVEIELIFRRAKQKAANSEEEGSSADEESDE